VRAVGFQSFSQQLAQVTRKMNQPGLYKLLLSANASNNDSLDTEGRTITHLATETGDCHLLWALVETVNGTPNAGEGSKSGTPLHIAVRMFNQH